MADGKQGGEFQRISAVAGRFGGEVWPIADPVGTSEMLNDAKRSYCLHAWAGYIVERLKLCVEPPGPVTQGFLWGVHYGSREPCRTSGFGETSFGACLDLLERWPMDAYSPFITEEEAAEIAEEEKGEADGEPLAGPLYTPPSRTADGVTVIPGKPVWVWSADWKNPIAPERRETDVCMETLDCEDIWTENFDNAYSTLEAAEAARAKAMKEAE